MAVADPWAEGGGRADVLPAGGLEARLLLLVPLLHLALAHPTWGQKDGVIAVRYGSWREGDGRRGGEQRDHDASACFKQNIQTALS